MKSILNTEVSCFKNYETPGDPVTINLLTWLQSAKHKTAVEEIRQLSTKSDRDKIKSTLPAITPSGVFTYRNEKNLTKHSGLIQFDIDGLTAADIPQVKKQLCDIDGIAYCGLSVSGAGLWGLIPISEPQHHKEHFAALEATFKKLGIRIDPAPKNIASLRGYSYDPEAYFNHNAVVFTGRISEQKQQPRPAVARQTVNNGKLLDWLIDKMNTAAEGERHGERVKCGRLCGGYIAGGILETGAGQILTDSYLAAYGAIDGDREQRKEIKAIQDGIVHGMNNPIYELEGDKPQPEYETWTRFDGVEVCNEMSNDLPAGW